MQTMRIGALAVLAGAVLAACSPSQEQQVARGKYLVSVMGCGDCHTPGGLTPRPDLKHPLSGSDADFLVPPMGTFSPPNLTPDKATGLGAWTTAQIVTAFTTGVTPTGYKLAPAMPWMDFANLTKEDATDIALYLQSLPPVSHVVPGPAAARACVDKAELCVVNREPLAH